MDCRRLFGEIRPVLTIFLPSPTLLVLASLSDGDKHGYAMMEDIERFAGLRLGPGTLYGAITRLEERGWIKPVAADDRRRPYALTASGREYLKTQIDALDRVLKTAVRRLKHA
jgi:DNA-binding PadR family transcriptional regulator